MDIFGNSSYVPSQTAWSQAEFLPGLNSFSSTRTTNTWSQTPPSNVPWGISYTQTLPNVVRFTGQSDVIFPCQPSISSSCSFDSGNATFNGSSKRRLDDDPYGGHCEPPPKQLITEEKMAARLNDMHISSISSYHSQYMPNASHHSSFNNNNTASNNNNNSYVSNNSSSSSKMFPDMNVDEMARLKDMLNKSKSDNNNSIQFSDIKFMPGFEKLVSTPAFESIIPESMIPRPLNSKALMLWTPPTGLKPNMSFPQTKRETSFIKSDDPNCSVVITEILDENPNLSMEEQMAVDV